MSDSELDIFMKPCAPTKPSQTKRFVYIPTLAMLKVNRENAGKTWLTLSPETADLVCIRSLRYAINNHFFNGKHKAPRELTCAVAHTDCSNCSLGTSETSASS